MLFSKDQLGNGINTLYSNGLSDVPFLYTTECTEERRVTGIHNLTFLYRNYFDRYCTAAVNRIGFERCDGVMGYVCYMFWDMFVVYPGNATPRMLSASLGVMQRALASSNENSVVSAIHGLGHWSLDLPAAAEVLKEWLAKPTTGNPVVLHYAEMATLGRIQ